MASSGSLRLFATGTVAVVTGSSRGIGAAVATELAAEGAHVAVTYKRDEHSAKETAAGIEASGGTCSVYRVDVDDEASVRSLFRTVRQEHDRIDVLVSNAGITRDGFLANMSAKKFDDVIRTNLRGSFLCCREAIRVMADQARGSIVTIASTAGPAEASLGQANYCASKAGVVAMTATLALEAARFGVRVNSVLPGLVETDMVKAAMATYSREAMLATIPLGRLGRPEEVAKVVAFVASDRAAYITAESIVVAGGRNA